MHNATALNLKQLIAMQHQAVALAVRRNKIRAAGSGGHLSKLRGRGMEFDEVRLYQQGDDASSIDWKVTARKGKPHVKLYREERERPVLIALDYRAPMFFGTQGALKSVVATHVAALLAWHGVQHGDRLGGLLFDEERHEEIKPMRGRKGVLSFLYRCTRSPVWQTRKPATPSAPLATVTRRLRHVAKHGSLIYILSDFRGLDDAAVADLARLARHNDVVLVSVLDQLDTAFPDRGVFPVFDGRQYFELRADAELARAYQAQYMRRKQRLQQLQRRYGMFYFEVQTHENVADVVRERLWA